MKQLYLIKPEKTENHKIDVIDKWIRFVATTRLTGHSNGYFSVYTLPPNQAASKKRQIKINEKLNQTPEYRNVTRIILRKTKQLLRKITDEQIENLSNVKKHALFLNKNSYELFIFFNQCNNI